MKKIMIDMDNVITDGVFLNYINEYFNQDYKLGDFKEYCYVQGLVGDNNDFWEFVSKKNFYENAPLISNCYEVLKKLNKKYELYIVTAYLWNESKDISGINLMNKYNYLRNMLPFINPDKFIFASNKRIMNFDIRIDDRISNLDGAEIKLLFNAWHNQEYDSEELNKNNIIRVDGWKDIEKILLGDKNAD